MKIYIKVHLNPKFFLAEMKLFNIHIKNLIILSVSGIFKGFINWQKVAEIGYQLVHDRVSRGLALFLILRHRLIYMALTLCEHACKTVCDVKSRIDPSPAPARSWDKEYQISSCTVARKIFRCCEKMLSLLEQLQVCIFAEIVFGVRCTLKTFERSRNLRLQNALSTLSKECEIKSLTITIHGFHALRQPWITQSVMFTRQNFDIVFFIVCKIYFLVVLWESESVSNRDF